MRYKRIDYNLNVMRKSACLVIKPIMDDGFAALFNCTPVDQQPRLPQSQGSSEQTLVYHRVIQRFEQGLPR